MEIQADSVLRVKTPRVKAIFGHCTIQEVVVCLFSGDIQLYDRNTFAPTRNAHIADCPVRSGIYLSSMDWILLGLDDGFMVVMEYGSLRVVDRIKAHDDFVRKIIADESTSKLVTVSDDSRVKLWVYSSGDVMPVHMYKDAKHFVMDAAFCPTDRSIFVTVSLDGKARMYSTEHTKCLGVFRGHEDGVNCVEFIGHDLFATGSDDTSIMIWDFKRRAKITVLPGHTKSVNGLHKVKNGFVSCSEDGTMRLWNSSFRTVTMRSFSGRVWCAFSIDDKLFVGTDEELVVYKEETKKCLSCYVPGKIFYNKGDNLRVMRTEEMGIFKEIGKVDDNCVGIRSNETGKLIGTITDGDVHVFSFLGLRKKLSVSGSELLFYGDTDFCIQNSEKLLFYSSFSNSTECSVPGLFKLLWVDKDRVLVTTSDGKTLLISHSGTEMHTFDLEAKKAVCTGELVILFNDKIHFFSSKFEEIGTVDIQVCSFCFSGDILYVSTLAKSLYLILGCDEPKSYSMPYLGSILGASKGLVYHIYSWDDSPSDGAEVAVPLAYKTDEEFILFQRSVLRGELPTVTESIQYKAVAFYEELGKHKEALQITTDENQRFEILLRIQDFETAYPLANIPTKLQRLGEAFMKAGKLSKAAECFRSSGDWNTLLLVDAFSGKKYLGDIGREARRRGEHNLAFMAYFLDKNYNECLSLLRTTPFAELFRKTYFQ